VLLVSTDLIAIRLLGLPAKLSFARFGAGAGSGADATAGAALQLPGQGATEESPTQVGDDAAAELPEDEVTGSRTAGL
jgi:hypothetical protein